MISWDIYFNILNMQGDAKKKNSQYTRDSSICSQSCLHYIIDCAYYAKVCRKKSSQFFLTRKEHLKLIKPFLDPLLPLLKLAVPSDEGGCNFLDAFERGAPSQLVGKNYFRKVNTAKETKGILGNKYRLKLSFLLLFYTSFVFS